MASPGLAVTAPGAETQQEVKDIGGGTLNALVQDTEGNVTGLMQAPEQ